MQVYLIYQNYNYLINKAAALACGSFYNV